MTANVLSIAGSDPSGGAGIQADLKAFAANGVYGMAALTALTAQNTQGVSGVHAVPPGFVADQVRAVIEDVRVDAVKIGMIANAEIAIAVADQLERLSGIPIVLDPVMVAKGGARLLAADAIDAVVERLMPLARVVTPNLPELAVLAGGEGAADRHAMVTQAAACLDSGCHAVLAKGGHLDDEKCADVLVSRRPDLPRPVATWFEGRRHRSRNTHGTGCTLSSALAACLARGRDLEEAVAEAKDYVNRAIAAADALEVGSGHGPVHHFHALWAKDDSTGGQPVS